MAVLVRHIRSRRVAIRLRDWRDKVIVRPFDRPDRLEYWQLGDFTEELPNVPPPSGSVREGRS